MGVEKSARSKVVGWAEEDRVSPQCVARPGRSDEDSIRRGDVALLGPSARPLLPSSARLSLEGAAGREDGGRGVASSGAAGSADPGAGPKGVA